MRALVITIFLYAYDTWTLTADLAKRGQVEKLLDWQHRRMVRPIIRRDPSHGTQPAGVERADEELCHDASVRLLAELTG